MLTVLEKHERDAVAVLPAEVHAFFASGAGDEVTLESDRAGQTPSRA